MSADFNVYVGVFIKLPEEFDWLGFSVKYGIDENEFAEVSIDESDSYLIPNQDTELCESYSDTSSNEIMELNTSEINKAIKGFKKLTKEIRTRIKKDYDEEVEVSYGIVPYYS